MTAFLILCWVSCVIKPEEIEIFSVVDANLAPPPPPKIFAGAYARPETGTDKHTSAGEMYGFNGFWLGYFVSFLRVFEKSFRICRQGTV